LSFLLIPGAQPFAAQTAPSTYNAYTGTDVKVVPPAPALGPANSVIIDPTFGSRILRVTDANIKGGESFISTDSGFSRTWNANSTAIKLTGPSGDGYWLEFNPSTFQAGTGSGEPVLHPLSFGATWEWSAVQANIIYYLSGSTIETYNTTTGASTPLASTPTGDPVTYMAAVVVLDNWVCAAAGAGSQDTYTKIFCVKPSSPSSYKFIDVANALINGAAQSSPNWPTSAAGETIGIHDISGGTGPNWLEVTFHQQSWGGNGGAVFNLSTNTWSLVTGADPYWSGHVSMGNGKYENASGSINGHDSRGAVLRNPDSLMNSSQYLFVMQPSAPSNNWCDADHNSWLNSATNPNAPILDSRYSLTASCQFAWSDEIIAAAVDGSNTVWRFAHNFNGGSQCYYAQAFAQISNDGNWALFSSYWGGTLGPDTSFGCTTRIDTFIVNLKDATGPLSSASGPSAPASQSITFAAPGDVAVGAAPVPIVATASSGLPVSLSSTTAAVCSISGTSATIVGAGTCSIAASQAGNANYSAAAVVTQSFTVTAAVGATPTIAPGGIAPIFSSSTTIQPGSWVSIYGTNLASTTAKWNGNFPTALAGVTVTIDGKSAYLSYVSPTQINLQAPDDSTTGTVNVTVTNAAGSATSTVTLGQFGPSFLLIDGAHIAGIIPRSDGSGAYGGGTYDIVGPTGTSLGFPTVAAKPGDTVEIFGVGFGPTNPLVPAGQAFRGAAATANPVQLAIAGAALNPLFAGLSAAGVYQINVTIPTGLGSGDQPLAGIAGGTQTQTRAVISLQ
jgi:uncharacterized protein (TIGR03437 family)